MKADERIDQLSMDAPLIPTHRPGTKREVWERYSFIYGDIKTPEELRVFCRDAWVWDYVYAVNFKGWRRHPDYMDGEAIIYEAVRREPFPPDWGFCVREVQKLAEVAKTAKRVATERKAA
jgi:hypothetical protein